MPMRSGFWISASATALAILLGCAAVAIAQEPDLVVVSTSPRSGRLQVSFRSDTASNTSALDDPRELLVTFDAPVRVELPAAFADVTAGWIAGVQTGYDTLLLRAARDVRFDVTVEDGWLDVVMVPIGPADAVQDAMGQRRLELLRAQLFAQTGREGDALRVLSTLEANAPADPQVLTALGLTERRIGWRRPASATLHRALAADRTNTELRGVVSALDAEHAPAANADLEQKTVAGEYRTRAQRTGGARALGDALRIGGRLEFLRVDAQQVRYPDGQVAPVHRLIQWGDAWLRIDTRKGMSWQATAFAAPSGLGASVEHQRPGPSGQWTVQAEARRPFWEYEEAFAGNGTRDRVAIGRRQKLWHNLEAWITAAANRYAVDTGAATGTTGVTGGILAVLREAGPFVAASYGLDKESRQRGSTRTDAAGVTYDPVPIQSREVHVPGVQLRQSLGASLSVDAYAGYAIDRLGGRGAVTEVHGRFAKGRVSAEVWVDHRLQTLATTTTVTRVGASVGIRF